MKSPLRSLALATTLALALSAQASAETVTLQLSNATVDVPEGWTHKDAGNNTMALDEPTGVAEAHVYGVHEGATGGAGGAGGGCGCN